MGKLVSVTEITPTIWDVLDEYNRARAKHGAMRSSHEGYAVILEELDEVWDEIKANNIPRAKEEMVQVAAMALAFLLEV